MNNLGVYIPLDRRQALARNLTLAERATGAALIADISGFTPLTEALADELGPQHGAEELTRHLNLVYGALIEKVHAFGGSVIVFSGDAFTVWFDGDDGSRAITSGLLMQQIMPAFEAIRTPSGNIFQINIKVGVAAGSARRFMVGEPSIQRIDVLAGALMDRLALAESQAHSGEVVISPELLTNLPGRVKIQDKRTIFPDTVFYVVESLPQPAAPVPEPAAVEIGDDIARDWILPQVYERLKSGQANYLAELRPAVSLFLGFSGIDYDNDEMAGQKLDTFIRWVQAILARYQGFLMHLTMDDKGSYLHATWGAPIAHEDDTVRAVTAAVELLSQPPDFDFLDDIRIGLSLGLMRTGATGGPTRRDYGVLGTEANVAARLMTLARPGQILVTKRIVRSARHRYDFVELAEPVALKGVSKPLPIFEAQLAAQGQVPLGRLGKGGQAAIVGRKAERALLAAQLEGLSSGQGGVAIILGEAGIGKTRLLEDVLDNCVGRDVTTFFGTGDAIEQTTLYYAWRPIFSQLFNLKVTADNLHDSSDLVLKWLQGDANNPDLTHLAPLVTAVLPLDLVGNETTTVLVGRERAEATRDLLVTILQRAAQQRPLLIAIEDAHWLDSASWALVQRVAEQGGAILLIIATRPPGDPLPPEFVVVSGMADAHVLTLGSLESTDLVTMIEQRLGVDALPQPVAEFILEKGGGNPFFCEELAYALRDSGFLTIRDGVSELAPGVRQLQQLDFPDTVQGVIMSRIDLLSPQQQLSIKVASVIGRIFALRTLADVYPVSQDVPHLIDNLNSMARLDLTPLESPEPNLSYIFKHIIIQEVAYSLLLYAQRQQLHQMVAGWYERVFATDLASYYALLAHHWTESIGQPAPESAELAKALDYLYKAGEQALRNNALQEAIEHLSKGLELVTALPETGERLALELRFQVLVAIPLTLTRGWASPDVGDAYLRAHEICRLLGERPELFLALVGIFTYYLVRAQFEQASDMADVNLDVANRSEDSELILEASQDRGAAYFYTGDPQASLAHFAKVHDLFIPEEHHYHVFTYGRDPLAVAMQHESLAAWCLGYPDRALEYSNKAVALTGEWRHPFSRAWVLASRCVTLQLRGEVEAMQEVAEELMPLAVEQGFPNWLAQGMIYLGWALASQGQTTEGIAKIHEGLDLWRLTGAQLVTTYFLYLLADAYVISGEWDQAAKTLVEAIDQVERTGERWWAPEIYRLQGQVLLTRPAVDHAEVVFQQALALAQKQQARSHELRIATSLAEMWREYGQEEQAYGILEPIFSWFQEGMATRDLMKAQSLLSSLEQKKELQDE